MWWRLIPHIRSGGGCCGGGTEDTATLRIAATRRLDLDISVVVVEKANVDGRCVLILAPVLLDAAATNKKELKVSTEVVILQLVPPQFQCVM